MTMTFVPNWEKPKLATILSGAALDAARAGTNAKQRKALGLRDQDMEYKKENNKLRSADAVFLSFFNETDVRRAVQRGQASFNSDGTIKTLLTDMIGAAVVCKVDQGTHQAEDSAGGGYKLHFDVRRPDNLCFHFYVGQDSDGMMDITEISYMNGSTHVSLKANG